MTGSDGRPPGITGDRGALLAALAHVTHRSLPSQLNCPLSVSASPSLSPDRLLCCLSLLKPVSHVYVDTEGCTHTHSGSIPHRGTHHPPTDRSVQEVKHWLVLIKCDRGVWPKSKVTVTRCRRAVATTSDTQTALISSFPLGPARDPLFAHPLPTVDN